MKPFQHSKITILTCILRIIEKYETTYCWPTLATMNYNLEHFFGVVIAERTLRLHLMELRDGGYLKSFRRYGVREDGTIYNKPSNRQLTMKGLKFLKRLGIQVAGWLWKWALYKILPFRAKKQRAQNEPAMDQIRTGGGTALLRDIIKNIVPPVTAQT